MSNAPLQGVKVVELGVWVAGPAVTGLLADWGADVLKIEPPTGDPQRAVFGALGVGEQVGVPPFEIDNRGKRSVVLDLRNDADLETMMTLIGEADIFVTATGNEAIITAEHMAGMKHNAIVCNIGHFDNEIDMAGLARSGATRDELKAGTDLWTFPDGHAVIVLAEGRLVNLGCATGHPSFVMSCSFSNQVIAQIELFTNLAAYPLGVYVLPKHLDEKVAFAHLEALGVKLTQLTDEQAEYMDMNPSGPFKPEHYRY